MNIKKIAHGAVTATMCMALLSGCGEAQKGASPSALSDEQLKMVQEAHDVVEIQNVMGRYVMPDAGETFAESVLELFDLNDPNVTITINGEPNVGAEAVTGYWNMLENVQLANGGLLGTHMLTSPVIVISDDGMTADGMWQDVGTTLVGPGMGYTSDDPEHPHIAAQEASRYKVAFHRTENGWKISNIEWQILWEYPGRLVDESKGWISDTTVPVFTPADF